MHCGCKLLHGDFFMYMLKYKLSRFLHVFRIFVLTFVVYAFGRQKLCEQPVNIKGYAQLRGRRIISDSVVNTKEKHSNPLKITAS